MYEPNHFYNPPLRASRCASAEGANHSARPLTVSPPSIPRNHSSLVRAPPTPPPSRKPIAPSRVPRLLPLPCRRRGVARAAGMIRFSPICCLQTERLHLSMNYSVAKWSKSLWGLNKTIIPACLKCRLTKNLAIFNKEELGLARPKKGEGSNGEGET